MSRSERDLWTGILFMVGSCCFAFGAAPGISAVLPAAVIGSVFFIGSLFFTSAAVLQLITSLRTGAGDGEVWAAAIQLVGGVARHREAGGPQARPPRPGRCGANGPAGGPLPGPVLGRSRPEVVGDPRSPSGTGDAALACRGHDTDMIRAIRPRGGTAALLLSLVLLGGAAGCSGTSTDIPPSAPPDPSTAAAPPSTGGSACADLVAKGDAVGTAVRQLVDGQGSRDQVTAAVEELVNSVAATRASSSGARSEALDDVQAAADKLRSALQAQPIDLAAVRAAAQESITALRELGPVCATGSSATPSVTTTA